MKNAYRIKHSRNITEMCIRDRLKEVNRRAEIDATGTMCTEGIIKGNENGGFVCMDELSLIHIFQTGRGGDTA